MYKTPINATVSNRDLHRRRGPATPTTHNVDTERPRPLNDRVNNRHQDRRDALHEEKDQQVPEAPQNQPRARSVA